MTQTLDGWVFNLNAAL